MMGQDRNGVTPTATTRMNQQSASGQMTDRDRLTDILATQKYLTDSLNVAAREASHDDLHRDVLTILTETHQAARTIFNAMYQRGWYKTEAAESAKVNQAIEEFRQMSAQLPYGQQVQ
ncbi:MAG: spore coat protein [Alicyclobacillaceae bacterium]|jgi:spore coat protein CotF|uniref:spore coat protein n=1 Tax=Alicyclobacillus sp. SP_1 TaxID=2942475 RepID=UPI002157B0B4|nr:spore coat protein [Alicyclobacillus sp. SP_1]MCY0889083.1 spore coat protein [Alicyclobacillaceae bacterium]